MGGSGKKEPSSSLGQKSSELVGRLGRFSISKVSGSGGGAHGGFIPLPSSSSGQHGSSSGSSIITPAGSKVAETEYIQVDTSFPPPPPSSSHRPLPLPHHVHKRGILNQLIDKVRSKDDRKKSTSSSVSGSSVPSSTANAMSIAAAASASAASNRAAAR